MDWATATVLNILDEITEEGTTRRWWKLYLKCTLSDESLAKAGRPNIKQWHGWWEGGQTGLGHGPGEWESWTDHFLQFPRPGGSSFWKCGRKQQPRVPSKNLKFSLHLRPRNTRNIAPETWIGNEHFQFPRKLLYKYRISLLLWFQDKCSSPLCYKCIFIDILAAPG